MIEAKCFNSSEYSVYSTIEEVYTSIHLRGLFTRVSRGAIGRERYASLFRQSFCTVSIKKIQTVKQLGLVGVRV